MRKIVGIVALLSLVIGGPAFSSLILKNQNKTRDNENKVTACVLEALQTSGLGEIKFSILSESKFQQVNGAQWILLAGQTRTIVDAQVEVGNTSLFDYFDTENISTTLLPAAGGRFLRTRNNFGSSTNPSSTKLGEFQSDDFRSHNHSATSSVTSAGGSPRTYFLASVTPSSVENSTNTNASGGSETRSANISVNAFIKIKRGCLDSVIVDAQAASDARITALETFNNTNVCDACLTMPETDLTLLRAKHTCFKNEVESYENNERQWSVSCTARTVGYSKKVLMLIGAGNRNQDENDFLSHLDNQYPYYNVISTN